VKWYYSIREAIKKHGLWPNICLALSHIRLS
jgi:hypothetical protein